MSRRALEGLALEEYKNGHITDPELLLLLGFETRYELDGFLKTHGVYEEFTMEDFEHYLILIDHIDLLPALFEKVILPSVVQAELTARRSCACARLDRHALLDAARNLSVTLAAQHLTQLSIKVLCVSANSAKGSCCERLVVTWISTRLGVMVFTFCQRRLPGQGTVFRNNQE